MFHLFRKKQDLDNPAFRRKMAAHIAGQQIKYVTERGADGVDNVIGRAGALILRDGELLVYASQDVVFRARVEELTASELMSKDGVILTAPDLTQGGKLRTIIAYYTYYLQRNL